MNKLWSFTQSDLSGLYIVQPFCAFDNRGFFLKDYSDEIFRENGISYELKEIFYSFSQKHVIRGLHFQRERQMPKLVRCLKGRIFDVVCDIRKDSPTFGQWRSFILSEDNMTELLIPGGFAHGFMALDDALVSYKCAECFSKDYDDGIVWNDPVLAIDWDKNPEFVADKVIISDKDQQLQSFDQFVSRYGGLK